LIVKINFYHVCKLFVLGHGATLELGFEPRTSVLETDVLTVNTIPVWWQRWELHPHHSGYEPDALSVKLHCYGELGIEN
jgi:hypothetical protein